MPTYEFTPSFGNRPAQLVGRSTTITSILEGLETRPGSKERALVVLGQRGYGKTVLLWELADRARERGFVVASPTSVREGLVERIVEKLQEDGEALLGKAKPSVSGGSMSAMGLSLGLEFSPADSSKTPEHRLTSLCRKLTQRKLGVLILVDELQANDAEVRRLVGTYQELVGERLDVAMVLAGLPSCVSATLNDRVLTFLNRARKHVLGPLPIGEIDAFYKRAFRADAISIDAGLRRDAAEATEGSPYLMQLVGYYIVSYAEEGGQVSAAAFEEAMKSARAEFQNDVCATTLAPLSAVDVSYLRSMAKLGDLVSTSAVARQMGVSTDYAQQYRRRLLEAGVIEAPIRGFVRFAVPYLADYLNSMP